MISMFLDIKSEYVFGFIMFLFGVFCIVRTVMMWYDIRDIRKNSKDISNNLKDIKELLKQIANK